MGKINECLYKVVSPDMCTVEEAGEYYFHQNVMALHEKFADEYEKHEMKQMAIRSTLIRQAMNDSPNMRHPKLNSIIFGTSSTKNNVILIADL